MSRSSPSEETAAPFRYIFIENVGGNVTVELEPRLRVLYSFAHRLGRPGIATTALHQVQGLVARSFDVTLMCASSSVSIPGLAAQIQTIAVGPHRALAGQRLLIFEIIIVTRRFVG